MCELVSETCVMCDGCVFLKQVLTCCQCLELECAQGGHCCLNSHPAALLLGNGLCSLPRQQWNRGSVTGGGGSQEVRAAVERPLYKTLASRSNSICASVCVCVCGVRPYACVCKLCVSECRRDH